MEKFVTLSTVFSLIQIQQSMTPMVGRTCKPIRHLDLVTETGSNIGNQLILMIKNSKDLTTEMLKLTLTDMD